MNVFVASNVPASQRDVSVCICCSATRHLGKLVGFEYHRLCKATVYVDEACLVTVRWLWLNRSILQTEGSSFFLLAVKDRHVEWGILH